MQKDFSHHQSTFQHGWRRDLKGHSPAGKPLTVDDYWGEGASDFFTSVLTSKLIISPVDGFKPMFL